MAMPNERMNNCQAGVEMNKKDGKPTELNKDRFRDKLQKMQRAIGEGRQGQRLMDS